MTTIAIMQPYWCPFEGYFRLLSQSDVFVALDDVQFPRRGRVHRNKLLTRTGVADWLTLPLEHAPQEALIKDMAFAPDAVGRIASQMRRFPAFDRLPRALNDRLLAAQGLLVPYLMDVMDACCRELGVPLPVGCSSDLGLAASIKGQDRIIQICKIFSATRYLNAPGGVDLYDPEAFAREGIELSFLPPWEGRMESVLQVLSERETA